VVNASLLHDSTRAYCILSRGPLHNLLLTRYVLTSYARGNPSCRQLRSRTALGSRGERVGVVGGMGGTGGIHFMTEVMLNWLEDLQNNGYYVNKQVRGSRPDLRERPLHTLIQQIWEKAHAQRRLRWHSIANARAARAAEASHDVCRAAGKIIQQMHAGGDDETRFWQVHDLVERGRVGASARVAVTIQRPYFAGVARVRHSESDAAAVAAPFEPAMRCRDCHISHRTVKTRT
jgi:hypothetical protein